MPKVTSNMLGKFLMQIALLQADTSADRYLATLLQRPEEIPTGAWIQLLMLGDRAESSSKKIVGFLWSAGRIVEVQPYFFPWTRTISKWLDIIIVLLACRFLVNALTWFWYLLKEISLQRVLCCFEHLLPSCVCSDILILLLRFIFGSFLTFLHSYSLLMRLCLRCYLYHIFIVICLHLYCSEIAFAVASKLLAFGGLLIRFSVPARSSFYARVCEFAET